VFFILENQEKLKAALCRTVLSEDLQLDIDARDYLKSDPIKNTNPEIGIGIDLTIYFYERL
jgi:hypothetical protein